MQTETGTYVLSEKERLELRLNFYPGYKLEPVKKVRAKIKRKLKPFKAHKTDFYGNRLPKKFTRQELYDIEQRYRAWSASVKGTRAYTAHAPSP
jgi:hypothetical protein